MAGEKERMQGTWDEVKGDAKEKAGDVTKMTPNSPVEMVFRRNRVDGWRILSEKSTAWAIKAMVICP